MAGANVGSVVVVKGEVEPGNLKQENVAGIITERGTLAFDKLRFAIESVVALPWLKL